MNTIPQPSSKSLILLTLFSVLLAIIILLIVVLPAEYNIDPTGLGKKLGLTVLAKPANTLIQPSVISCSETDQSASASRWQDSVVIIVPSGKGLEYKFYLLKDKTLEFVWNTDGKKLYFDFHGEPEGSKDGYFKRYKESKQNQSSGTLSAPFSGSHGWYWENKTSQAVTIKLKTRGDYKVIGLL